jgi:hypothetical protein
VKIAQEMLAEARPMVQGVQVSAPFGRYGIAAEVLGLNGDDAEGLVEVA